MKIRKGFISNSSSSSFIITNKSNKDLTIVDFVLENPQLVDEWNKEYGYNNTFDELLKSANDNNFIISKNSSNPYIFGDEDDTIIGKIFDYILRNGGESKNFKWKFDQYYR